jgi:hypothetical protein
MEKAMKVKVFRNAKAILGSKVEKQVELDVLLDLYDKSIQVALNANTICEIKDKAKVRKFESNKFNWFVETLKEKGDKADES